MSRPDRSPAVSAEPAPALEGRCPEGGVPGTLAIPLAELPRRLGEMRRDREIWTVCGSGRRATIAASLLDLAGIPVTAVVRGGVRELADRR